MVLIKKLTLCIDTKHALSKKELRNFLLESSNLLVDLINNYDQIAKFLSVNPFSVKNTQIIIYNRDSTDRECFYPEIGSAQIANGIMTFRTLESEQNYNFNTEFTETYEEALKITDKNL